MYELQAGHPEIEFIFIDNLTREGKEAAQRLGVTFVPTVLLYDSKGTLKEKIHGFHKREFYTQQLEFLR